MIKNHKIPTILGIIVLLVGTFAGVFFLSMTQVFKIGADAPSVPKDVRVSNISDSVATISWTTDKEASGFISWGESQSNTSVVEKEDENDQKFFVHSVDISGLKPSTSYFYKINSNGTTYDNNGIAWNFKTGPSLALNTGSQTVSGQVIDASGQPVIRAIVYASVQGYLMSTLTSNSGNYVFQLGNVRTPDLLSLIKIDNTQTLIEISVIDGPSGVASAQVFPQSGNPVPSIILGQIYDFRNNPPNSTDQNPNANLNLPNTSQDSKFQIPDSVAIPSASSVILESLSQGEVVTSDKPEFFGKGPKGETITITVHSENPVTDTVKIPNSGSWSWSVPSNLAPGNHTITINWIDATGITRSLTRDFVVQAGELPAFVATPSQTLKPSTTATATATIKPSPTATATAMPVPVTGNLTPTLLLSIMGIAVLIFSGVIWKTAEN